jgi:hypothetical protein
MTKKSNTFLILIGTIGLILIAVIFSTVIEKAKNNPSQLDIRAKASIKGSMMFLGTISEFNENENILIIDKLMFEDSSGKSLGTWKITPPATFNPAKFPPGTKIRISANPVSFQIATNTLTALEIEKK